ncbi:UDP-glycosyltransferase 89A2-like [Cucurbita maxima]|uniref:Glycosyltransferase n=1 Tax=Cucurbita maxima TaxID=3661 RepID=A0A6J1IRU4_CUCMA|nr:UDP-glycosyltransferase 89A2-like [Cucurbita maxima]
MASPSSPLPHLLLFPYPAQGHMLPLLDLTHFLASYGFPITVLVTPKNLPILQPLLSAHPAVQTLVLPFPSVPGLPPGVENIKDIGNEGNVPIIVALRQLQDPIVAWFKSHPSPPSAIISDFFLGWTQSLAQKLQIPRVSFFSSGCWVVDVLDYCWRHVPSEEFRKSPVKHMAELPNSPSFTNQDLPEFATAYRDSDPLFSTIRADWFEARTCWAHVFNTFDELEPEYLEFYRKLNNNKNVFGVGPLSLVKGHNPTVESSSDEVLKWLDERPDGSVLYISFGSQKQLNQQQMEALASGIEKSGTRFVWVVKTIRQTDGGSDGIPIGFEDRVSGRGMVVKRWVPQEAILRHRAVRGFLSHCGWNSILESLASGVPIFAWAMEGDQMMNSKILVDQIGVAVQVCHGDNSVPDPDQLGEVLAESFNSDKLKAKARALSKAVADATGPNGSSLRNLQEFAKKLASLPPPTK